VIKPDAKYRLRMFIKHILDKRYAGMIVRSKPGWLKQKCTKFGLSGPKNPKRTPTPTKKGRKTKYINFKLNFVFLYTMLDL
jgi:hypothetical protein